MDRGGRPDRSCPEAGFAGKEASKLENEAGARENPGLRLSRDHVTSELFSQEDDGDIPVRDTSGTPS